jgi:hypothetical protein
MSFITKQGLALAILSIALAMPGIAAAVSYEVQLEVPEPYQELLQNNIDRAHSHFPGHAVKSERWELAICFSTFQRPAL